MIFTTSDSVDGHEVTDYIRVIAGETATYLSSQNSLGAAFQTAKRLPPYEQESGQVRESALNELWHRGQELGADGVIGISFNYSVIDQYNEAIDSYNNILLVTATGTAVRLRRTT